MQKFENTPLDYDAVDLDATRARPVFAALSVRSQLRAAQLAVIATNRLRQIGCDNPSHRR